VQAFASENSQRVRLPEPEAIDLPEMEEHEMILDEASELPPASADTGPDDGSADFFGSVDKDLARSDGGGDAGDGDDDLLPLDDDPLSVLPADED
jgi:hypothetical protein